MSHLQPRLATLEIGPTTICMAEDKPLVHLRVALTVTTAASSGVRGCSLKGISSSRLALDSGVESIFECRVKGLERDENLV
jgi:hypothetical protein